MNIEFWLFDNVGKVVFMQWFVSICQPVARWWFSLLNGKNHGLCPKVGERELDLPILT